MTSDQIQYWRNVEQQRSNLAQERETNRANLAREQETYRHNVAQIAEAKRAANLNARITQYGQAITNQHYSRQDAQSARKLASDRDIALKQLAESKRASIAREYEQHRSAVVGESLRRTEAQTNQYIASIRDRELAEKSRAARAGESLQLINLTEQGRANIAREQENLRSNQAQESLKAQSIGLEQAKLNEQHRANVMQETLKQRQQVIDMRGQNFQFAGNLINTYTRYTSDAMRNVARRLF